MLFHDEDDYDGWGGGKPNRDSDFEQSLGFGSSFRGGSWWLRSRSDPRWNSNGRSACVSGFSMPTECKAKIEELKGIIGNPPEDLEYGYMKD